MTVTIESPRMKVTLGHYSVVEVLQILRDPGIGNTARRDILAYLKNDPIAREEAACFILENAAHMDWTVKNLASRIITGEGFDQNTLATLSSMFDDPLDSSSPFDRDIFYDASTFFATCARLNRSEDASFWNTSLNENCNMREILKVIPKPLRKRFSRAYMESFSEFVRNGV